ncbi:MAG: single-stranded-DNA-specific exonuclease RecJ [Candidatus Omnitrophota bacterium]|nr:MAG: single-stranded-DNA-specific exonuclease RecJ [Candidatus Omnitrophota bacterium]
MTKKWLIKKTDLERQKILSNELSVSRITAQILLNRGIDTPGSAYEFLRPSLLDLRDPFLMNGMRKSVSRIKKAIERKEQILIHGDYDVDGICATTLLELVLKKMGAKVSHYIPDRIMEGFGISENAIKLAIKRKTKLFISVDCGITAKEQTKQLNSAGIDVIITDHHQPSGDLPDAFSILNPLQKCCRYPYKDLAGVGVAFKLASALCGVDSDCIYEHLDLVCLGTVSDVVPITDENRILTKFGLEQVTNTKKKGLQALISVARLKGKEMSSHYVGYILGPRINAAGRLSSAEKALQLLLTDNSQEADLLAETLDVENRNRQKLEQQTLTQALAKLEQTINFKQDRIIVLQDENWHSGVIGIVASRLVDRYHRPALIMTTKGKIVKGSGRSIKNFHLVEALDKCSHLLENFGGHCYAAGLTMHKGYLEDFRKLINEIAQSSLKAEDLIPTVEIDMEIGFKSLSDRFFKEMSQLAPFGLANHRPVFATKNLKIKSPQQIIGRDTIKMWVTDGDRTCEAIGFRMAGNAPANITDEDIDLAYTCSLNTYRGVKSIQLQLKDIQVKSPIKI